MHFPQETVEQAKETARLISLRSSTSFARARALFDGDFLHISYGFDDAIKQGTCGIYLHEVKRTAECFSFAGINFVVAQQLGLDPQMYYAIGMQDIKEGQNRLNKGTFDHAFLTVRIGSERYLFDKNFSLFGKCKILEDQHVIRVRRKSGTEITNRFYQNLRQLSADEYISMLERNRQPGGGRIALSSGQRVRNRNYDVFLEYDDGDLSSSLIFSATRAEGEPDIRQDIYSLRAPVSSDGRCSLEEGIFSHCFAREADYKRAYWTGIVSEFMLPARVAFAYVQHLEAAARHFGRKNSMNRLRMGKVEEITKKCGFDRFGNITIPNGVDPDRHNSLLESIDDAFDHRQQDAHSNDRLQRSAYYTVLSLAATVPDNPLGLLYSEQEHWDFFEQHLIDTEKRSAGNRQFGHNLLRVLIKHGKRKIHKLVRQGNILDCMEEEQKKGLRLLLDARYIDEGHYKKFVDWTLFVRDHPLGSVQASEEDCRKDFRRHVHEVLQTSIRVLPVLQVHKFRKGLQRILRESEEKGAQQEEQLLTVAS